MLLVMEITQIRPPVTAAVASMRNIHSERHHYGSKSAMSTVSRERESCRLLKKHQRRRVPASTRFL